MIDARGDDLAVRLRKIADAMTTTYLAIEPDKFVDVQAEIRLAAKWLDKLRDIGPAE